MSGAVTNSAGLSHIARRNERISRGPLMLANDLLVVSVGVWAGLRLCQAFGASSAFSASDFSPVIFTAAMCALLGGYRSPAVFQQGREQAVLIASSTLGFSAAELCTNFFGNSGGREIQYMVAWIISFALMLFSRWVWMKSGVEENAPLASWVIVGRRRESEELYQALATEPDVQVAAIFCEGGREWLSSSENQRVVCLEPGWAKAFAECCGINRAILALPENCDAATDQLLRDTADSFETVVVAPHKSGDEVSIEHPRRESGARSVKRFFDMLVSAAAAIVLCPFWLAIVLAIRMTSRGPVFYSQPRIGRNNRIFRILKFRTMYLDAADRLEHHFEKDPLLRAEWELVHKLKDDPRVTPVGRWLRRFSLDELPQLWNVIAGDMSLVGPRPIVIHEIAKYADSYAAYERVRPGLTGLWQVSGRNDTTYRQRVDYDVHYVENWSLRLDARIIARTFRAVISGTGAY